MTDLIYFEDVRVGDTHRFGHYEVTREEIIEYARQFDPQPFHVDEEAARRSMFGGLIASGWHTGAMFIRMLNDHAIPGSAATGRWASTISNGSSRCAQAMSLPWRRWCARRPSRGAGRISAWSRSRAAFTTSGTRPR